MSRARVGVLASGRGSNMAALDAAMRRGEVPAEIVLVLSDRPQAPVLELARERGIAAAAIPRTDDRESHEQALVAALREAEAEWVCLAGYMRLLGGTFIGAFAPRILNIHPSLLPAFPGLEAQRQAIEHGVRVSGCTVHLVDEGLDSGPIVGQSAVEVEPADDVEALAARILGAEHQLYPRCLAELLRRPFVLDGRRLRFC